MNKVFWGTAIVMGLLVIAPPLLYKESYIIINNDTTAHLLVFEQMKSGGVNTLYFAQEITGYLVIWIERIFGVNIATSFMWLNFIALIVAGISSGLMVCYITKSKLAGAITVPIVIFGVGSTLHLFFSGTIFNIVSILILLPALLTLAFVAMKKEWHIRLLIIVVAAAGTLMFHPSLGLGLFINAPEKELILNPFYSTMLFFGIANLFLLGISTFVLRKRIKEYTTPEVVICLLLGIAILGTGVIGYLGLTAFSSRVVINMFLFAGLLLVLLVGFTLETVKARKWKIGIVTVAVIGFTPNLLGWIDRLVIKGEGFVATSY